MHSRNLSIICLGTSDIAISWLKKAEHHNNCVPFNISQRKSPSIVPASNNIFIVSATCVCDGVASTAVARLSLRRRGVSSLRRVTQQRKSAKYCPVLFIYPLSYWAQAFATWLIYLAIRLTKPTSDIIKYSSSRAFV